MPLETKRCPDCKKIERLLRNSVHEVQCSYCLEKHCWMFWIDITGSAAEKEFLQETSNHKERFIYIRQTSPTWFVTDTRTILPLCWEVIDRGPKFEVRKSETVEETVLARFADEGLARHLCNLLRGE